WRGRAISYASSPPAPGKNSGTSWTRRTRTSASIAISLRATSGSAVAPPTRRGPPPSRSLLRLRSRLRSVRHRALLHRHVRLRRRDRPRPRLRPEPRRSSPRLGSACSVASRSPSRARCASARTVARTRSTCPVASVARRSSRQGSSAFAAAPRWGRRRGPLTRVVDLSHDRAPGSALAGGAAEVDGVLAPLYLRPALPAGAGGNTRGTRAGGPPSESRAWRIHMRRMKWSAAALALSVFTLAACGDQAGNGQVQEQPTAQQPQQPAGEGGDLVAQGQQLFNGQGICFTCHGMNGTGGQLAPDLTDGNWLWIDPAAGDVETQIATLIETGV